MNDDPNSHIPSKPPTVSRQKTGADLRAARQKAALKANMAKRKEQAKARDGQAVEKSQGQ
jgi:hypothetical protein